MSRATRRPPPMPRHHLYPRKAALERLLSRDVTPKEIGATKIRQALELHGGRVAAAAKHLGVDRDSLRTALKLWASDLGDLATKLRQRGGASAGPGHPVEHEVSRSRFLASWKRNDQRIKGVATDLGIDRFVVRRLAVLYDAPGAPPPRRRGPPDDD